PLDFLKPEPPLPLSLLTWVVELLFLKFDKPLGFNPLDLLARLIPLFCLKLEESPLLFLKLFEPPLNDLPVDLEKLLAAEKLLEPCDDMRALLPPRLPPPRFPPPPPLL